MWFATEAIQRETIAARRAGAVAANAQVKQASLNLSYTKIDSPVSGVVNQRTVEVGQRVQPAKQLLSITQTDNLWVTANFKETQLQRIQPGQSVDLKVDAFETTYHGYVDSMAGAAGAKLSLLPPENATGNFVKVVQRLPLRIRFKDGEDPQHRLRPGMSVERKIWLYSNPN